MNLRSTLAALTVLPAAIVAAVLFAAGGHVDHGPAEAQAAETAQPGLRVYVIVLDGLMPHEVGQLTPNLAALRAQGTWYERARGVYPAETVPNHVAMMTGVLPERSGIVGNDFWAPNSGASKSKMSHPKLLGVDTLTTRLEERCTITTATVQSKGYLWGVFRGEPPKDSTTTPGYVPGIASENVDHPGAQREADYLWKPIGKPGYIPDPDDHAIDQATMNAEPTTDSEDKGGFVTWLGTDPPAPHFAFVNLGDIDRSGHVDLSAVSVAAGGISAFRQGALEDTDTLIGEFVTGLKSSGAWDETVLIFTSDHGMDWSAPDNNSSFVMPVRSIDVTNEMTNKWGYSGDASGTSGKSDAGTNGDYWVVPGGGTAAIYLEEKEDIADVATKLAAHPAVQLVATKNPVPGLNNPTLREMGMGHRHNGDVVILVKPGWAVRDSTNTNPLPGNHGHPVTQQSVLLVSGGHPAVDDTAESVGGPKVFDPAGGIPYSPPAGGPGNLSVAPTVAALFGIGSPPGGYARPPLAEAFEPYALEPHQPCQAASPPQTTPGEPGTGTPGTPNSPGTVSPGAGGDPGTGSPGAGGDPGTGSPGGEDRGSNSRTATGVPVLSKLTVRPRSFAVGTGATVRYAITQPSTTRFAVQRRSRGYRRAGKCAPRKPRAVRKPRRCTLYRLVRGSFARNDEPGSISFQFSGRLGGRRLKPGVYRLEATAGNAFGRSHASRATFRITRR